MNRTRGADVAVALPSAVDLPGVLLGLAVPHEDVDDLVALLPYPDRDPQVWWLLRRSVQALVRAMGTLHGPADVARLPGQAGGLHRYFPVYVFVAALPHVRAYHRSRGIPDEVSRLTLADLGRAMARHRTRHGIGGLDLGHWLVPHFVGGLYQLGRLQFQRARLDGRTGRAIAAAGLSYGPGDPALAVHIPAYCGPLSPAACDASFARARTFFARHFPEERPGVATCHSWLLDPQLAGYLPAGANILAFQRRFRLAYPPEPDDGAIVEFVFGRRDAALDDPPRRTTLERAVVDHLRAGRHWCSGAGWLAW